MNGAHFHLITNHIPVLGAIASLIFLSWAAFKNDRSLTAFSYQFIVLIGLLTLPAYFSGEFAEEIVEHLPGISEDIIEAHEDFGKYALIATEVLAAIALYGLFLFRKNAEKAMKFWKVILIFAIINTLIMLQTANLGGQINHPEIRDTSPELLESK